MSLIKINKNRFALRSDGIKSWLDTDRLFSDDFFERNQPLLAINVKENQDNFELELALPGFSKDDIEVTTDKDILCISGKNSKKKEQEEDIYTRKDFGFVSFERKMQLPQRVNLEGNIQAIYRDGVLKIELQKKSEAIKKPKKKIAIK